MDFLADTCVAGQTLLRLVSRGNAIVAELLRLSDNVPAVFTPVTDKKERARMDPEALRYQKIMFDFQYLNSSEYYEDAIDKDKALSELDAEFRENHIEILKRCAHWCNGRERVGVSAHGDISHSQVYQMFV